MNEAFNLKAKLPMRLFELLQKVGIEKAELLLLKSDAELQNLAPFTSKDIQILKKTAAEIILAQNKFITANEVPTTLKSHSRRLSSGCPIINAKIGGGFASRGITEIAGESRTGKTQLCLQLSLIVQYPEECGGFNSGAAFICTEDVFPNKRLQQLFETFPKGFFSRCNYQSTTPISFADNIYIEHATDAESLVNIVVKDLPRLIAMKKIGLIVIDSVGAVFRIEPVSPQRSNMMRAMAMELHRMASEHSITVVCINQVSTSPNSNALVPCLGLSWANLVTTRIQLYRSRDENPDVPYKGQDLAMRSLKIIYAPDIPQNEVQYVVDTNGILGVAC